MSYNDDPLQEITKAGGASDPRAAYRIAGCEPGMFGKRPAATTEVNTSSNSTVDNSNDILTADQVVSNKEAGAGGAAAMVKSASQSQSSGGQGGSGGSTGQGSGYSDQARFNAQLQQKDAKNAIKNPTVCFFPDLNTTQLDLTQRETMVNAYNRHLSKAPANTEQATKLGADALQVVAKMDSSDVQEGTKLGAHANFKSEIT